jgi:hypothetical protein
VVSFTPQPLYPQGKSPWYPLDRRLGGPQSRSGRGDEAKNSQPPPGIEPLNPDRPARSPALYRLSYHGSYLQRHKYFNLSITGNADNYFLFQMQNVNIRTSLCKALYSPGSLLPEFEQFLNRYLFSVAPRPERLWGPPSLLSNGYQGLFPWG